MAVMTTKTFRELTAPGYFNFSATQKPKTGQIAAWFDGLYKLITDNVNLFDDIFRLWTTRDYSSVTVSRTPWIKYLLTQYGIDWFNGNETQAAALVSIVSSGWSEKAVENFQFLFTHLSETPFFWLLPGGQIIFGLQVPAILAETFIIYSNSVTPPTTPSNTTYLERDWTPPAGWTLFPSSSTYFSRGYIVGPNIVWTAPILTTAVQRYFTAANLGSLPASPMNGDMVIVLDDGTGDTDADYFYDSAGLTWRKNSALYSTQGSVDDGVPSTPSQRVVATGSAVVSSEIKPPVTGPSKGFGIYGGLSGQNISSGVIFLSIVLTAEGLDNLGVIVNLFRRVKPTISRLFIVYTIDGNPAPAVTVEIFDMGAVI